MNDECARIWKESVIVYLKALATHLQDKYYHIYDSNWVLLNRNLGSYSCTKLLVTWRRFISLISTSPSSSFRLLGPFCLSWTLLNVNNLSSYHSHCSGLIVYLRKRHKTSSYRELTSVRLILSLTLSKTEVDG
jgi:hypothetical protein